MSEVGRVKCHHERKLANAALTLRGTGLMPACGMWAYRKIADNGRRRTVPQADASAQSNGDFSMREKQLNR